MSRAPASVHTLVWRQIRLPTVVMAALVVLVVRVGVSSYSLSGGARGMIALRPVIENPAVSALYGRVTSLASAGAFVEWKMGMFIALAIAMWAGLMATRVTRASEDDGTWDLLVVSRVGRQPALASTMMVLFEAGVAVGFATSLTLLSGGQRASDSVLYGLAMAGVAWSGVALGLLGSQFFAPRRSASQVALCSVGSLFIVRVLADGSPGNVWLRWLTPFGWLENVGAYHRLVTVWLAPLLALPAAAALLAWRLQRTRDVGAAWRTRADRSRARESLLRTPWRFAWRERWGMLAAWTVGLGVLGLVVGYLTNALVQLCRTDPGYVRLLKHWGFGSMVTGRGFIAEACVLFAVAISFMVAALLVSVGTDSYQGRLDLPLAYGTSRAKWLGSGVVTTVVATVVISMVCALATWIGVVVSGTTMGLRAPLEGMANALTMAPWLIGVSILLIALTPRFSFLVIAMMLTVFYLDAVLGPIMRWPQWLLDGSPFYHLHLVPVVPSNWGATLSLSLIGVAAGLLGLGVFMRRDVGH
jgi:ABC-2 type transport system permease protein